MAATTTQEAIALIVKNAPLENLFVHGNETTLVPTDNGTVPSLAGIDKRSRDQIENIRQTAMIQAGVYSSEPEGRLAVGDGEAFRVEGAIDGPVASYEYRRINADTPSQLIGTYPSEKYVTDLRSDLGGGGWVVYTGEPIDDIQPFIFVGDPKKTVFGWDTVNLRLVGDGILTEAQIVTIVRKVLASFGFVEYVGTSGSIPLVMDQVNRIIEGWDRDSNSPIGGGSAAAVELWPILKALNHLLLYGESTSVGAMGLPILSIVQPFYNSTFVSGPRGAAGDYSSFKPLVEDALLAPDGSNNRGETQCSGAANYASKYAAEHYGVLPADHVILATTAGHGSWTIQQLEKGSDWYPHLLEHVTAAHALNADHAVQAIPWIQGLNGIDAIDRATYYAKMVQLAKDADADIRLITGQRSMVHMLVAQVSGGARVSSGTALAQLDACLRNFGIWFVTPTYHFPSAADAVHLTAVGYKWQGAYFGRAWAQLVFGRREPDFLKPISATLIAPKTIRVLYHPPTAPMVIDRATLAPTTNDGFAVEDSTGVMTQVSRTAGSNYIDIALQDEPDGDTVVRCGLDYVGTGLTLHNGASTNVRDSTDESVLIDGVLRPLYHVSPHFELVVTPSKDI